MYEILSKSENDFDLFSHGSPNSTWNGVWDGRDRRGWDDPDARRRGLDLRPSVGARGGRPRCRDGPGPVGRGVEGRGGDRAPTGRDLGRPGVADRPSLAGRG